MELRYPLSSDLITVLIVCPHGYKEAISKNCKLSLSEARILISIARSQSAYEEQVPPPTAISTSTLAKDLGLSVTSVSTSVSSLERKGLIERIEDINDRRKLIVVTTTEGDAMVDLIDDTIATCITNQWSGLDASYQELLSDGSELYNEFRGVESRVKDGETMYDTSYFETQLELSSLFRSVCSRFNLNGNEFRILFELLCVDEAMSSSQIASKLLLRLNEITLVCNSLAHKGLVSRARKSDDKRTVLISLTPNGREVAMRSAVAVDMGFLTTFGNREVPEEDRKVFLEGARNLVEHQRRTYNPFA